MSETNDSKKGHVLAGLGGVVAGGLVVALLTKAVPKLFGEIKAMMSHMRET